MGKMAVRFLIFISVILLAEVYTFIIVKSAVKSLPPSYRFWTLAAYVLISVLSWAGFIAFRQTGLHSFPRVVRNLYISAVMGLWVGKILVLLLMLVDDSRRIVTYVVSFFQAPSADGRHFVDRSTFIKQLSLVVAGLSVGGFAFGVTNRYKYRVHTIKLKYPHLPTAFKGFKILQISDIHTGSFDSPQAVAHGIDRVLDQKADVIFFTGDLVNNATHEVTDPYKEIFSKLNAPSGVYSTLGNHDYGDYMSWPSDEAKKQNLEDLKKLHGDMGWRLLMNEHIVLERGEDKIAILGIENWGAKANFPKYGDMTQATHGLKEKNIPFKILLSHDPSHWEAEVRKQYQDIDLTLSGHTHGMQFGVDSKFLKWSPVQFVYKQWAGLYQQDNQYLYVNRGFGFIGYPGRLGILPEITVIELV